VTLPRGQARRSRRFCRDVLGLAIYREFGSADDPGVVFFQAIRAVSGRIAGHPPASRLT